jgi:hypothetical protein
VKGVRIIPTNADDFATVVSECGCHFVAFIFARCINWRSDKREVNLRRMRRDVVIKLGMVAVPQRNAPEVVREV